MASKGVKGKVAELVEPVIAELGMELVEVEYVKEGKDWVLRIYIYKDEGVSIDDCVAVNDRVSDLLDEHDPVPNAYLLEISSPGLDRPFKTDRDFVRYAGEEVDVQLYAPDKDGKKEYSGTLIGLNEQGNILISDKNDEDAVVEFERKAVSAVKRTIIF